MEKRSNYKDLLTLFILFSVVVSCSTLHKGGKPTGPGNTHFVQIPYIVPLDTNPKSQVKDQRLTRAQLRAYLKQEYRTNFDEFFAPEFKRLTGIIEAQALAYKEMAAYQRETRRRTDSIARERNHYRSVVVSSKDSTLYYQKLALELSQKLYLQREEDAKRNEKQIKVNTAMTISSLILVTIVGISTIILHWRMRKLSKKFGIPIKSTANV